MTCSYYLITAYSIAVVGYTVHDLWRVCLVDCVYIYVKTGKENWSEKSLQCKISLNHVYSRWAFVFARFLNTVKVNIFLLIYCRVRQCFHLFFFFHYIISEAERDSIGPWSLQQNGHKCANNALLSSKDVYI